MLAALLLFVVALFLLKIAQSAFKLAFYSMALMLLAAGGGILLLTGA